MTPGKNKIFVKQLEPETHTASGIAIPENAQKKQKYGHVVAIGDYNTLEYGELQIGDQVSFGMYAGEEVQFEGGPLLLLNPNDIYSVMSDGSHYAFGPSLIVEVERRYRDKVSLESGLELHLDPMYKPTENILYHGTVVSVPTIIPYDENDNSIEPNVNIGDKVYFRYVSVDDEKHLLDKSIDDMSEKLTVRVFYSYVFAVVKHDKIETVGNWVLGEPFIDAEGVDVEVPGESGMVTIKVEYFPNSSLIKSTHTENCKNKAIVAYSPKCSPVKAGDIVFSKHSISFENNIEGKNYYCFRVDKIDAVIGSKKCEKCKNDCPCKKD